VDAGLNEWRARIQLNKKLAAIGKQQRRWAGSEQNWDYYQFTASPTCPPTTGIVIRGGRACFPSSDIGLNYYYNTATIDFTSGDASAGYAWPYTCLNSGWYVPIYIGLYYGSTAPDMLFYIFGAEYASYTGGGFVEYETAGEAEAAIYGSDPTKIQDHVRESTLPICRAVLRVSGAGVSKYMVMDAVNRGRSYLLGQFRDGRYEV
jgi:hypothetical protein